MLSVGLVCVSVCIVVCTELLECCLHVLSRPLILLLLLLLLVVVVVC